MSSAENLKKLAKRLNSCFSADRHGLKRQLDRLRSESGRGKDVAVNVRQLSEHINRSLGRCEQRRTSVPIISYPDLPVSGKKDEIAELIKNNQVTIVCGETGSEQRGHIWSAPYCKKKFASDIKKILRPYIRPLVED